MTVIGSMAGYTVMGPVAVETGTASDAGGTKTELVGTIKTTGLNASLPLRAGFNTDPSRCDGKSTDTQIRDNQSTNYKTINSSAVPVYVYISDAKVNKDHMGNKLASVKDISLISKTDNISTLDSVMLVIKDAPMAAADGLPTDTDVDESLWLITASMTASSNKYYLNDAKGKMEVKTRNTGTELNPKIYGLAQNDWAPADKFLVAPTFMVSTVEPP